MKRCRHQNGNPTSEECLSELRDGWRMLDTVMEELAVLQKHGAKADPDLIGGWLSRIYFNIGLLLHREYDSNKADNEPYEFAVTDHGFTFVEY